MMRKIIAIIIYLSWLAVPVKKYAYLINPRPNLLKSLSCKELMIIKLHLKQHYKPEFNKTFQTFLHGATQHRILKIYSLQLKVTH